MLKDWYRCKRKGTITRYLSLFLRSGAKGWKAEEIGAQVGVGWSVWKKRQKGREEGTSTEAMDTASYYRSEMFVRFMLITSHSLLAQVNIAMGMEFPFVVWAAVARFYFTSFTWPLRAGTFALCGVHNF